MIASSLLHSVGSRKSKKIKAIYSKNYLVALNQRYVSPEVANSVSNRSLYSTYHHAFAFKANRRLHFVLKTAGYTYL